MEGKYQEICDTSSNQKLQKMFEKKKQIKISDMNFCLLRNVDLTGAVSGWRFMSWIFRHDR